MKEYRCTCWAIHFMRESGIKGNTDGEQEEAVRSEEMQGTENLWGSRGWGLEGGQSDRMKVGVWKRIWGEGRKMC